MTRQERKDAALVEAIAGLQQIAARGGDLDGLKSAALALAVLHNIEVITARGRVPGAQETIDWMDREIVARQKRMG